MLLSSDLSLSTKNTIDATIACAAGAAVMEWLAGYAATGAAIVAALLGLVRLVDALVTLYERRTVQKWLGRTKHTRKED